VGWPATGRSRVLRRPTYLREAVPLIHWDGVGHRRNATAGPTIHKSRAELPLRNVGFVMNRIRLLIVDDEARVREGLRMRLASEPDLELVGESGDGATALRLAQELRPDVIVIDVLMPGMDGLQAIRLLQPAEPASRVLAFSVRDDLTTRREAASAGAAAFVAKQEGPDLLLATIRDLARNRPPHGSAHG
jgi:CheY-like chemotaxis protein